MKGVRLDVALVRRGLARSRGQAVDLIDGGRVLVNGRTARKASEPVSEADVVVAETDHYVSRAAHKLAGALAASGSRVSGRALDAGASTGGFTQVLLEQGCSRVYAVDVGHGQLAPEVAADPRVVAREGLNLRDLALPDVDSEPVDVVVGDVSFISLTLLLGPILGVLSADGFALLLVKPQFEVGRAALDSHGVVADAARALAAVDDVVASAASLGWACTWRGESVPAGAGGNREYFIRLVRAPAVSAPDTRLAP